MDDLSPAELRAVKKAIKTAYERGRAAERKEFDAFLSRMRALKELNGSGDAFLKAWDESKHPRDHGKFSSAPGGVGGGDDRDDRHDDRHDELTEAVGEDYERFAAAAGKIDPSGWEAAGAALAAAVPPGDIWVHFGDELRGDVHPTPAANNVLHAAVASMPPGRKVSLTPDNAAGAVVVNLDEIPPRKRAMAVAVLGKMDRADVHLGTNRMIVFPPDGMDHAALRALGATEYGHDLQYGEAMESLYDSAKSPEQVAVSDVPRSARFGTGAAEDTPEFHADNVTTYRRLGRGAWLAKVPGGGRESVGGYSYRLVGRDEVPELTGIRADLLDRSRPNLGGAGSDLNEDEKVAAKVRKKQESAKPAGPPKSERAERARAQQEAAALRRRARAVEKRLSSAADEFESSDWVETDDPEVGPLQDRAVAIAEHAESPDELRAFARDVARVSSRRGGASGGDLDIAIAGLRRVAAAALSAAGPPVRKSIDSCRALAEAMLAHAEESMADGDDHLPGVEALRKLLDDPAELGRVLADGGADDESVGKAVWSVLKAWEESKHPRDHGKFSSAPGGGDGAADADRPGRGERSRLKIDVPDRHGGDDAFDVAVIKNPTADDVLVKAKSLRSSSPIRGLVSGGDVYVWWEDDVHHQPVHEALDLPGRADFKDRILIYYDRDEDRVSVETHSPNAAVAGWARANGFAYEADTTTAKAVRRVAGWGARLYVLKAWDESKHPRGKNGHFISRDRIDAAKSDPKLAKKLKEEVKPEDAGKLDAALEGKTDLGRTKRGEARHQAGQRRATREEAKAKTAKFLTHLGRVGDLKAELTADDLHDLADHLGSEHVTIDDVRAMRHALAGAGAGRASFGGAKAKADMVKALQAHAKKAAFEARMKEHGVGGADAEDMRAAAGLGVKEETPAPAPAERTPPATGGQYGAWGRAAAGEATAPEPEPAPNAAAEALKVDGANPGELAVESVDQNGVLVRYPHGTQQFFDWDSLDRNIDRNLLKKPVVASLRTVRDATRGLRPAGAAPPPPPPEQPPAAAESPPPDPGAEPDFADAGRHAASGLRFATAGDAVRVTGNTREHAAALRRAGFRWVPKEVWDEDVPMRSGAKLPGGYWEGTLDHAANLGVPRGHDIPTLLGVRTKTKVGGRKVVVGRTASVLAGSAPPPPAPAPAPRPAFTHGTYHADPAGNTRLLAAHAGPPTPNEHASYAEQALRAVGGMTTTDRGESRAGGHRVFAAPLGSGGLPGLAETAAAARRDLDAWGEPHAALDDSRAIQKRDAVAHMRAALGRAAPPASEPEPGKAPRRNPAATRKPAGKPPASPTPPAPGFGDAGPGHPLAAAKTRDDKIRRASELARRAQADGRHDVGGVGDPSRRPDFLTDAARDDILGAVGRHQLETTTGTDLPGLYEAVGRKHGLTKHQFQRALVHMDDAGDVRLKDWPRMIDEVPDPDLLTWIPGDPTAMYHVRLPNTADPHQAARSGDPSVNTAAVRSKLPAPATPPAATAAPEATDNMLAAESPGPDRGTDERRARVAREMDAEAAVSRAAREGAKLPPIDLADPAALGREATAAAARLHSWDFSPRDPSNFLPHKVPIADVYDALAPRLGGATLDRFKDALVRSFSSRGVQLEPIDMRTDSPDRDRRIAAGAVLGGSVHAVSVPRDYAPPPASGAAPAPAPGNSPTRVDTPTRVGDTAPTPATGTGGTVGGGKVKSKLNMGNGVGLEYEHPEPLANDAGSVAFSKHGVPEVVPNISDKMRAVGVTKVVRPIAPYQEVATHPTAGEGVAVETNKGKTFLSFANNPGVKDLLANARSIAEAQNAARNAHFAAARDAVDQPLLDSMRAKEAEYAAKIPADHERVRFHRTGDSDGIPVGDYKTADGTVIPWNHPEMVHHGTASAIRPGAMGAFATESVHSIPKSAVAKIKAEGAARERASADANSAEARRVADLGARARETGKPQLVRSWTEPVDEDENSLNVVHQYVHPDGTTKTVTIPTH